MMIEITSMYLLQPVAFKKRTTVSLIPVEENDIRLRDYQKSILKRIQKQSNRFFRPEQI
jgi:hypothetical protein